MKTKESRPGQDGSTNKTPGQEFSAPSVAPSSPTLTAALDYASKTIPAFFLSSGKRPLANCRDCNTAGPEHVGALCNHLVCHGHLAATCDPDRLRQMASFAPRGLLAVRTGAVSGLVIVDIDPRHGGNDSLRALIGLGLLPPTQRVITGSGGQHLFYLHPGQRIPSRPLPGWPGVDIKGDGGYVVAPPSIHPRTGRAYVHVDDGRVPVELSPALLAAVTQVPAVPVAELPRTDGIRDAQKLLSRLLATVASAPEGRRRTTLYGASRGVARIVAAGKVRLDDAIALLHEAGAFADQSDKDRRNAITDAFRAEGVAL